ncbi:hypothetical protein PFICI_06229 [Pestalotiopsis fici W106-1]|uniref:Uncharacterized protein n=1 Tax=Pestalotiopsis fici (strain W106-1 / CGMCC3.15140) TaxID=1229662 RepID=W3X777_PESFW|nr:uncharacterized protein PFICI_06229 [Pestalotiopsis fici W106-1]ETS81227.1 hypothetical protein PFICI_06229 [Pestalotiopsis fici W106-1]
MPRSRATKKGGKRVLQKARKTNQTEPGEDPAEASLGVPSSTSFRERLSNIFGKPSLSLRGRKKIGRDSDSNDSNSKDGKDKAQLSSLLRRTIKGLGRPLVGPLVGLPREKWQCAKCRATCHLAAGTGEGLLRRWFWQLLGTLGAALTGRRRAAATAGTGLLEAKYQGLEFQVAEAMHKFGKRMENLASCIQDGATERKGRIERKRRKKQERDRQKAERLELELCEPAVD